MNYVPLIVTGFVALTVGFVSGWFAHVWACRRDAANRIRKAKDEFFSVLAAQKAQLDSLNRQKDKLDNPAEDLFLRESVEAMTAACYRVQNFLTAREWLSLSSVLRDYQAHKEQYSGMTRRCVDVKSGVSFVQRLAHFMDKFDECISKSA